MPSMRIQVIGSYVNGAITPLPAPIGLAIGRETVTIGRSPRSTPALVILDSAVSKEHARVEPDDDAWLVTDLYSDNGIYSYPDLQRHQSLAIRVETRLLIGGFLVQFLPSLGDR